MRSKRTGALGARVVGLLALLLAVLPLGSAVAQPQAPEPILEALEPATGVIFPQFVVDHVWPVEDAEPSAERAVHSSDRHGIRAVRVGSNVVLFTVGPGLPQRTEVWLASRDEDGHEETVKVDEEVPMSASQELATSQQCSVRAIFVDLQHLFDEPESPPNELETRLDDGQLIVLLDAEAQRLLRIALNEEEIDE